VNVAIENLGRFSTLGRPSLSRIISDLVCSDQLGQILGRIISFVLGVNTALVKQVNVH
jgi:hypothetical protein